MSIVLDGTSGITTNSGTVVSTTDATLNGLTVGKGGGNGAANTAFGVSALAADTLNSGVTAIGNHAGAAFNTNSDTGQSTFVGYYAGASCVTGTDNTFVGGSAGVNTTGSRNTAVGSQALQLNTTASNNTAVGYQASYSSTVGYENTAIGYQALYSNTSNANTAVGWSALKANTTGSTNTAVGDGALTANTTGTSNSALGLNALSANTTGSYNTALGYIAGNTITTGSYYVMIGYNSQPGSITGGAEIVIGTSNVTGKGANTGFINPGGGGVYQGNNSAAWSITSDQRLKKNIVDNNNGLDIINQIQVRNFEYRLPEEITELPQDQAIQKQGVQLGAIAQELQQILPECVKTESTGVMTVDADNLTWYLVNAVKELTARIKQLEGN